MSFLHFTMFLVPFVLGVLGNDDIITFDTNYIVMYGNDHVSRLDNGGEIQLSLDNASGSGFMSKKSYSSGFFQMNIKLPEQQSPGVVSTIYLTSNGGNEQGDHDEIDFEFLGTDGPPFTLQTNIFANDNGRREQRLRLWFDPTKDFHKYGILWNHVQIVFFVDDIPIRVFKNNEKFGVRYPMKPMFVEGSIWNGDAWASGGRKIDWSKAPFQLHYRMFNIDGCESGGNCYSDTFPWNTREFWLLTPPQQSAYENVKQKYVFYDYCSERGKFFKECQLK